MRDYRKEAIQKLETFDHLGMDTRVVTVGRKLIDNESLSDADLWTAIYYLTDEDYQNERHAILFFASRLA